MRFGLLSLLATLAPSFVFADVKFTSPAPGSSIPAGTITVQWTDSGIKPPISQLSSYSLFLMVGGNDPADATDSIQLTTIGSSPGSFAKSSATGQIPVNLAQSLTNGFYLKMISAGTGGSVINYSGRFTITGMTGTLAPSISAAVKALGGSTAGPPTENDISAAPPAAAAPADTPAAGDPVYDVPYAQQTGLTKYCPMQGVPPTKITQKKMTPMYPTSAWTVAKTFLPPATILTTLTAPFTFSVQSHINTEPPVPGPSGDMQKFLARWKD